MTEVLRCPTCGQECREDEGRARLVKELKGLLLEAAWGNLGTLKEVADALVNVHLTHQQRLVRLVHALLEAVDRYPHEDGRNEAARAWVKKVLAADPDARFPMV